MAVDTVRRMEGLALVLGLTPLLAADAGAQVEVFGFSPTPEGSATLTKTVGPAGGHQLVVGNIGSSGKDGVSFAIGGDGADGWCSTVVLDPSGAGGENLDWSLNGSVDGGASQPLGALQVEYVPGTVDGPHARVASDNAALGTGGQYTLRLWDDAWLKHEQSGLDADDVILVAAGPAAVSYVEDLGAPTGDGVSWRVRFDDPVDIIEISGPGGTTPLGFYANELQLVVENTGGLASLDVDGARVHATDTGDVSITGAAQSVLGQWVRGNDEAQVREQGGRLLVDNLGSSGCDGVSIAGGSDGGGGPGAQTRTLSMDVDALDPVGTAPPGTVLDVRVHAAVLGAPHSDFASQTFTKAAQGNPHALEFGCDPLLVATTWFYEYRLAGVVQSGGPVAGQQFAVSELFASDLAVSTTTEPGGDVVLAVEYGAAVTAYVDGNPHDVDEIRLVCPASAAWQVTGTEALSVEADGVASFSASGAGSGPTPQVSQGHAKCPPRHVTILKQSLTGGGPLTPGSTNGLAVGDLPANAVTGVFVGFAANPTPFKQGLLVPVPVAQLIMLVSDANGALVLPFSWPDGIPPRFSTYLQAAAVDPGPPQEVIILNALELVAQ